MSAPNEQDAVSKGEMFFALAYFAAYMVYLFLHPENEAEHWVSLVLIPFVALGFFRRGASLRLTLKNVFNSVGLRKDNVLKGILYGLLVGIPLSLLQLLISNRSGQILDLVRSGKALYLFPVTFVLMFLTAGFTEEFFFRGVLQVRMDSLLRSKVWSVVVCALFFGLYHLPYAYLNPHWPSHGDFQAALVSALGQGGIGGLVLGSLFIATRGNLWSTVLIHTFINVLPAMTMIKMSGG